MFGVWGWIVFFTAPRFLSPFLFSLQNESLLEKDTEKQTV